MKFVAALVLSSLISVLMVDCHNPHDEKGGRNPLGEAHQTETQLHKDTVDDDAQYPDSIGEPQIGQKTVFVDDSEEDKPWKEAHFTAAQIQEKIKQKRKGEWKSGLRGEIERSLQLTMELQSVKDMNVDLSNSIANIKGVIESSQHNLTMELQSVKDMSVDLSNSMANIKGVIESSQHNLTMELQSVKAMNMDLSNKLKELIDARYCPDGSTEPASTQVTDGFTEPASTQVTDGFTRPDAVQCPEGFFNIGVLCYKIYNDTTRTWHDSKSKCESDHLVMATKPVNAITLRSYIVNNIGDKVVWLSAKGDGTVFRWASSGEAINNTNALWWPNQPTSERLTTTHCLMLMSHQSHMNNHPTQPFYPWNSCYSTSGYALCQYAVQCPEGFFTMGSHCYKLYNDTARTWNDSKSKCESDHLVMAGKPDDAIALRSYIVNNIGDKHVWLSAKGDNTVFRWESSGEAISNTSSLWYPRRPGSYVTTSYCLVLASSQSNINSYPTQPFYPFTCTSKFFTLCEYLVE